MIYLVIEFSLVKEFARGFSERVLLFRSDTLHIQKSLKQIVTNIEVLPARNLLQSLGVQMPVNNNVLINTCLSSFIQPSISS
jgi:hypothetical protein